MISLHSCFVAGLTLVYCIWRDRSLFSYDALEATRACSQILTIFGEKWPGAIKYRDIFDALSGSLFKLTIKLAPSLPHSNGSQPLRLDMDTDPAMPDPSSQNQSHSRKEAPAGTKTTSQSTMSHMVTDAVKEAFMEVDEEAPGGWQGWRMWNEMVRDEVAPGSGLASRYDEASVAQHEMSCSSFESSGIYGIDPIQDAAMQMGESETMDESQWNFGGYR
jgi:hypothetical protein